MKHLVVLTGAGISAESGLSTFSLVVRPAATLIESVPWKIPCYIIDPGDFYEQDLYGFEHIKTTAVAGVDILKERLEVIYSLQEAQERR